MSKIFYDHLIILEEVGIYIDKMGMDKEEKEEVWKLIDELIHYRIFGLIFDHLPREHHEEFIDKFYKAPHDEMHIHWLNSKIPKDIEKTIVSEIKEIEKELLQEIKKE